MGLGCCESARQSISLDKNSSRATTTFLFSTVGRDLWAATPADLASIRQIPLVAYTQLYWLRVTLVKAENRCCTGSEFLRAYPFPSKDNPAVHTRLCLPTFHVKVTFKHDSQRHIFLYREVSFTCCNPCRVSIVCSVSALFHVPLD